MTFTSFRTSRSLHVNPGDTMMGMNKIVSFSKELKFWKQEKNSNLGKYRL